MDFAVILIATIVGCFALRNPLKALPVAFYAAAIAIGVVYFTLAFFLAFGLFAATFHSAIDRRRQLERELEE